MIRTEKEYTRALERLEQEATMINRQREQFQKMNLGKDEIKRALDPLISFHEQLKEEVEAYEQIKRGDFGTLYSLRGIGRWLIGLRIARGWTQSDLADKLNVSQAQVSKDENNEYHGISLEKAQKILDVFDITIKVQIDNPEHFFDPGSAAA